MGPDSVSLRVAVIAASELATTQHYADMVASDLRAAIALLEGNSGETGNQGDEATR